MSQIQDPRAATTTLARVDPTFKTLRMAPRPIEPSGVYRAAGKSGVIAASTVAGIQACLRYFGSGALEILSWRLGVNILAGYTKGQIQYNLFLTRQYSITDTGSTIQVVSPLRDIFSSSQAFEFKIVTTGVMSGGTGNDDPQPVSSLVFDLPTTITGQPMQDFFRSDFAFNPLRLTWGQGIRLRNTAYPATGTCNLVMALEWQEGFGRGDTT